MVLKAIKKDNTVLKGELVILEDTQDGCEFGTINFRIENDHLPDVQSFTLKKAYRFGKISKAVVWGDLRDRLSITCDGIYPDDIKQTSH